MEELAILLLGCIPVIPALGKWSQVNPWGFLNSYPNLVNKPLRLVRDPVSLVTKGLSLEESTWGWSLAFPCKQAYAHKHPKHMCIHTHMNIQMYSHTKQVRLRAIRREGWRKEGGSNWGRGGREGRRGERFLKELIECRGFSMTKKA